MCLARKHTCNKHTYSISQIPINWWMINNFLTRHTLFLWFIYFFHNNNPLFSNCHLFCVVSLFYFSTILSSQRYIIIQVLILFIVELVFVLTLQSIKRGAHRKCIEWINAWCWPSEMRLLILYTLTYIRLLYLVQAMIHFLFTYCTSYLLMPHPWLMNDLNATFMHTLYALIMIKAAKFYFAVILKI